MTAAAAPGPSGPAQEETPGPDQPEWAIPGLDEGDRADLLVFARRARALEPTGVIRLASAGGTLVATVRAATGDGLLGRGTILGLRATALHGEAASDSVFPLTGLINALAHGDPWPAPVAPGSRAAGWVGLGAPRSGWEPLGPVAREAAALVDAQVLTITQAQAALAAAGALGFLPDDGTPLAAYRCGAWTRLSTPSGHLLLR